MFRLVFGARVNFNPTWNNMNLELVAEQQLYGDKARPPDFEGRMAELKKQF